MLAYSNVFPASVKVDDNESGNTSYGHGSRYMQPEYMYLESEVLGGRICIEPTALFRYAKAYRVTVHADRLFRYGI